MRHSPSLLVNKLDRILEPEQESFDANRRISKSFSVTIESDQTALTL